MEKKSERLEVRLGYQEKQAFTEACDSQGDTPSSAIRRFISGYVRRSDVDLLSSAWRVAAQRRGVRSLVLAVLFLLITGAVWVLSQYLSVETDEAIFSARDRNGDRQLEYAEHGIPPGPNYEPSGVMRVLDLDGSGTISREEFVQKGRMVYMLRPKNKAPVRKEDMPLPMNVVEFKFSKEHAKSGTYKGAVINAEKFDRLVIWQPDGTNAVWEGNVTIASSKDNLVLNADNVIYPKRDKSKDKNDTPNPE